MTRLSRRSFLQTTTAAWAAGMAWPHQAAALSPNGKLRTAHVGVGGMGGADLKSIASHPRVEVAGLCDIDAGRLQAASGQHPGAKTFRDFREMLTSLGDSVDAVVVSTPDHTHAPAAITALNAGKPVYCQKPLTHEVFEARRLREVAEERQLVTQMGIQVHSSAVYRRAVRMIQDGVIGKVSQVHAWSNKNWGYDGGPLAPVEQPPETIDWDLWLGTAAERPFVPNVYHPGQWRKLIDFGTGTLGDMGVHIFDTPYAALELTAPLWARTTCRPPTGIGHPESNVVEYEFPGTAQTTATLLWTWYDGHDAAEVATSAVLASPVSAAAQFPSDFKLPGQGALFIGEGGVLLLPHVAEAQLFPQQKFVDYERPQIDEANHYHQWVDACCGEGQTSASFSYGGPLTEALLLGVVANRYPGQQLTWDADQLAVTNLPEANALLRRAYRPAFAAAGLS